jgi:hypothetical protein
MQTSSSDARNGQDLSQALEAFARHQHVGSGLIVRLLRESESFREICADYEECCARLQSLEQKHQVAGAQMRDYIEMRQELERDLLQCLESAGPRPERDEQDKAKSDLRQTECDKA